jgi:spermidine synthase
MKNSLVSKFKNSLDIYMKDIKLSFIVLFIAGCGLVYQYLLASYASRVIGSMETVIYTVITLMMLGMGGGAFLAKFFKNKFLAFSILESVIGLLAVFTIFIVSGTHALSNNLPIIISNLFNIPIEHVMQGGIINKIHTFLNSTTYIMAGVIGLLIGMEIPLIASIREELHKGKDLENNVGVIYGVDYIGAGIGATIYILVLMQIEIYTALGIVATTNVLIGFLFICFFRKNIKHTNIVVTVQVITALLIWIGCSNLSDWEKTLKQSMFKDPLIYSYNTQVQNLSLTKGKNIYTGETSLTFFINGKTQFSEEDEGIYHSFLVYPAIAAAGMPKDILIIGGGDGLALRDILRTNPNSVTLLDLDGKLINFFKNPVYDEEGLQINEEILELNENAFNDERVNVVLGDAYLNVKKLLFERKKYGAIIVDLPDPSHPDLNKLYTTSFYEVLNGLLADSGAIAIQSTSPYLAKNVFLSIGKTLKESGFIVNQYQHIIPSFGGQWGWTIGTKIYPSARDRLGNLDVFPIDDEFLTRGKVLGAFEFGKNYYQNLDNVQVNRLGSQKMYQYYLKSWERTTKSVFE